MAFRVVEMQVPARMVEEYSELLWELPKVAGLEEASASSKSGIFEVPEEFEILEFGSDAAKKAAKWIHSQRFRGNSVILLKVYFDDVSEEQARATIEGWIVSARARAEILNVLTLEEKDYAEAYRQSVKGQSFGKNLWVGPPWETPPDGVNAFVVEPGLAFGTGEHPTTQLCLEHLEGLSEKSFAPARVLDLGCGTGVLALAAKRFFPAAHVMASDIDPQCAEEFSKICRLNGVGEGDYELHFGAAGTAESLASHLQPVDLLISNIYAEVLAKALPAIKSLLAPGAMWIASGILEGASEDILHEALEKHRFRVVERKTQQRVRPELNLQDGLAVDSETWVLLEMTY